jgi:hypothetical protein
MTRGAKVHMQMTSACALCAVCHIVSDSLIPRTSPDGASHHPIAILMVPLLPPDTQARLTRWVPAQA